MQPMRTSVGQSGFTLIELLIVVAIIGILAAIAVPAYQDYTKRARVSEGLSLATSAKNAVSEYYISKSAFPSNNTSAGLPAATDIKGESVQKVEVSSGGLITITFTDKVENNNTLLLSPFTTAGSIQWKCKKGSLSDKYLPSACK
jgi:type IV pilus assembly protein PilA